MMTTHRPVFVWDMEAGQLIRAIDLPSKARAIAQISFVHSYDAANVAAVLGQDGLVYLIDADNSMLLSEIGRFVSVSHSPSLRVVRLYRRTGQQLHVHTNIEHGDRKVGLFPLLHH